MTHTLMMIRRMRLIPWDEPLYDTYPEDEIDIVVPCELSNVLLFQVAQYFEVDETEHIDFLGVDKFEYHENYYLLKLWNRLKTLE